MLWFQVGINGLIAFTFFGAIMFLALLPYSLYESGFFWTLTHQLDSLLIGLLFLGVSISLYQRKRAAIFFYCALLAVLILLGGSFFSSFADFLWLIVHCVVVAFIYLAIRAGELR